MNLISIPPDPTGPGCVSVRIEIGRADIRSTVALLQNARHLLERDGLPASRYGSTPLDLARSVTAHRRTHNGSKVPCLVQSV